MLEKGENLDNLVKGALATDDTYCASQLSAYGTQILRSKSSDANTFD